MNCTFVFIILAILTLMCGAITYFTQITGMQVYFGLFTVISGFGTFAYAYNNS
jgi:hypothetical protein